MFTFQPEPISIILLSALLALVLLQVIYYFGLYSKFLKVINTEINRQNWQGVSVIVCARSEYDNLQNLVPALLAQDYPNFEVIIVDDASWDGTTGYLEELEKNEPKIKAVFVTDEMKKYYQGKKLALSLGIKAASNELILLTDADCIPASNDWISHMVEPYHSNPNIEIVLGYSPVIKESSFTNICSRIDNVYTGANYFSFALNKDPYMGVGRNLSYKKSLFFKVKGFASHLHIAPGDDDLFVRDAATQENTAISMHPDSFVNTSSKKTFAEWFKQKKRHNFVGKYYKSNHKAKLSFIILTHGLLWATFIANMFFFASMGWALAIICIYLLIKWPMMYQVFKKLKQSGLSIWVPVFDLLYVFYNFTFGFVTLFSRQKKW
ncbi:MAG TPA: glycosyltransferase [Bacteroidia bacterium]